MIAQRLTIALGGNSFRDFKQGQDILTQGASRLAVRGILEVDRVSPLYETLPHGCLGRQPRYLNALIIGRTSLPLIALLQLCKSLEREAGRRKRGINAARPLDIDLIDYGGRCIASRALRPRKQPVTITAVTTTSQKRNCSRILRSWLTLPHPEMHRRRFVLEPLADIAPHWRHPVLGSTVRQLLARLPRPPGSIRRVLDSQWFSCDKAR